MKGRPRISQEIHELQGSYVKNPNRKNKQAPTADGQEPEMPSYFNEDETLKWLQLVADFRANGILSLDNREILIRYCTAYGGWIAARRAYEDSGLVAYDEQGRAKRNPAVVEMHKFAEQMSKMLPEMGLTPASRQRLVSFAKPEDDPFAQWLEGVGKG